MAEAVIAAAASTAASYAAQKVLETGYNKVRSKMGRRKVKSYSMSGTKGRKSFMQMARDAQGAAMRSNQRTGGLIDIEKKFYDSLDNNIALTNNVWTDLNLNLSMTCPAQGDGATQRDGRVFFIHSIHVKGYLLLSRISTPTTSDIPNGIARIVLVWDTQANGAAVAPTGVFSNTMPDTVNQFRNLEHTSRYIVLSEKYINVRPNVILADTANWIAQEQRIPFKFNKTFKKPIKVRCSGTTSSVASLTDNNITAIATYSGNAPFDLSAYTSSRCRFTG
jgi:hypothetical protein